jgi:hypothetical protein
MKFFIRNYKVSEETIEKKIKKVSFEILSNSSLAFLLSPIRSKRILIKFIWIIFLFSFLFGSIYCVLLNIFDYLSFDITTSIYEINEIESQFPTISLCSNEESTNESITSNRLRFNYHDYNSDWKNHVEIYFDTTYGKCFRFNSGLNLTNQSIPIKYSKKSRLNDGFWFEFSLNRTYDYSSLIVYIHNHTIMPSTIYNKGIYISAGFENYFIISRIFDEKLEYPYNDCIKNISEFSLNKTIIDFIKNKKWEYSQKECISLCRTLSYIETSNCNCSLKSMDEKFTAKCYNNINDTNIKACVDSFLSKFEVEKCSNYCPLECDTLSYKISHSSKMISSLDNSIIRTKIFKIYIFYEDLKYTLITQKPKIELFGLISNIGGTLGLFIGFSFISVLELFELLVEYILIIFNY